MTNVKYDDTEQYLAQVVTLNNSQAEFEMDCLRRVGSKKHSRGSNIRRQLATSVWQSSGADFIAN